MRTLLLLALLVGVATLAYYVRGHLPTRKRRPTPPPDVHYGGAGQAMCGRPLRRGESVQLVPAYVTCAGCREHLPRD